MRRVIWTFAAAMMGLMLLAMAYGATADAQQQRVFLGYFPNQAWNSTYPYAVGDTITTSGVTYVSNMYPNVGNVPSSTTTGTCTNFTVPCWTQISGSGSSTGTVTSFATGIWPSWLVPTVTNPTTTPSLAVAVNNAPFAPLGTTVNAQTGSYTVQASDQNVIVTETCPSACTYTLPPPPSAGFKTYLLVTGASNVPTAAVASGTYNGRASYAPGLVSGRLFTFTSPDGTNWTGDDNSQNGTGIGGGTSGQLPCYIYSGYFVSVCPSVNYIFTPAANTTPSTNYTYTVPVVSSLAPQVDNYNSYFYNLDIVPNYLNGVLTAGCSPSSQAANIGGTPQTVVRAICYSVSQASVAYGNNGLSIAMDSWNSVGGYSNVHPDDVGLQIITTAEVPNSVTFDRNEVLADHTIYTAQFPVGSVVLSGTTSMEVNSVNVQATCNSCTATPGSTFYGHTTGNALTVDTPVTGTVQAGVVLSVPGTYGLPYGTAIVSGSGTSFTLSCPNVTVCPTVASQLMTAVPTLYVPLGAVVPSYDTLRLGDTLTDSAGTTNWSTWPTITRQLTANPTNSQQGSGYYQLSAGPNSAVTETMTTYGTVSVGQPIADQFSVGVSFTGTLTTASTCNLTVASPSSGFVNFTGTSNVTGTGIATPGKITGFCSGTPGGAGVYTDSVPAPSATIGPASMLTSGAVPAEFPSGTYITAINTSGGYNPLVPNFYTLNQAVNTYNGSNSFVVQVHGTGILKIDCECDVTDYNPVKSYGLGYIAPNSLNGYYPQATNGGWVLHSIMSNAFFSGDFGKTAIEFDGFTASLGDGGPNWFHQGIIFNNVLPPNSEGLQITAPMTATSATGNLNSPVIDIAGSYNPASGTGITSNYRQQVYIPSGAPPAYDAWLFDNTSYPTAAIEHNFAVRADHNLGFAFVEANGAYRQRLIPGTQTANVVTTFSPTTGEMDVWAAAPTTLNCLPEVITSLTAYSKACSEIVDAGAGVTIGSPTGGAKGATTLNVQGAIYANGVAVAGSSNSGENVLTSTTTTPTALSPNSSLNTITLTSAFTFTLATPTLSTMPVQTCMNFIQGASNYSVATTSTTVHNLGQVGSTNGKNNYQCFRWVPSQTIWVGDYMAINQ